MGLAVSTAVLLVTSYVAGGLPAVLITVFFVCVFGLLWFVLPLARRRSRRPAGLRDFSPAFSLTLAAKDAGLVGEAALWHGLDLPVFETIADRLSQGAAAHGDQDFSATYLTSAPDEAA